MNNQQKDKKNGSNLIPPESVQIGGLTKKQWFFRGFKAGIPIGLGYFAVSFALGITAKNAGMNALQSGIMSALMLASAGQYGAITVIAGGGSLLEMALTTLIVNLRYLLMACSLSQKVPEGMKFRHRFGMAYAITDEIFGAAMSVEGKVSPYFSYGAICVAPPGWIAGSVVGNIAGDILPVIVSNALGVALYGMFLAVIIPPARKSRIIAGIVFISMALSYGFTKLPYLSSISSGMQIIILTVVIAAAAAVLFPLDEELREENA